MIAILGLGGAELLLLLVLFIPAVLVFTFAVVSLFRRPTPAAAPRERSVRLLRSSQDSWCAGVCGGFAEYLGWSAGRLRFVWVLATVFTAFAGVVIYVALWFLMPLAPPPAPAFESPPMEPWKKGA